MAVDGARDILQHGARGPHLDYASIWFEVMSVLDEGIESHVGSERKTYESYMSLLPLLEFNYFGLVVLAYQINGLFILSSRVMTKIVSGIGKWRSFIKPFKPVEHGILFR